jgi:hypothetical protein
VWFQNSQPLASGRWRYRHSNQALSGIPDVIVTSGGATPLLIDAKNRVMESRTRPEESYKMLGYLENYREVFNAGRFRAVLVFTGPAEQETHLASDDGELSLLVAVESRVRPVFEKALDALLLTWTGRT